MVCCTTTQQQPQLRLRPPHGSRFVIAAPVLLVLVLLLAVFAQPSSCRPLPLADKSHHNNGAVVKAAAATDVILLPLPADGETTATVVAAPSVPGDEDRRHRLAGDRYQWLLNKKPRQKAPLSAPSKRTN